MFRWIFQHTRRQHVMLPELCPPEQLQRIVRRERLLADRFGGGFSLLLFAVEDSDSGRATLPCLALTLKRRLRETDEAGWFDDRRTRIGVVMHRTPAAEAWKVADDVCAAFQPQLPAPKCAVHYYPTGSLPAAELADSTLQKPAEPRPVLPLEPLLVQPMALGKRALDMTTAIVALLLLSPLLATVALLIKFTSCGPIFFHQQRTGIGGKRFKIYKFRSMITDAEVKKQWLMAFNEQDGPAFKIKNDPRVTAIGRFLRRTNIDELPQLWNVVRGDMSLVGPRPLPCNEADACTQWQRQRHDVTPGLTCIWQIWGSRDSFDEWVRMDVRYIRTRSLLHDLKLILCTLPVIVIGRRAGC